MGFERNSGFPTAVWCGPDAFSCFLCRTAIVAFTCIHLRRFQRIKREKASPESEPNYPEEFEEETNHWFSADSLGDVDVTIQQKEFTHTMFGITPEVKAGTRYACGSLFDRR